MDLTHPAAAEALRLLHRMYARLEGRRPAYETQYEYLLGKHPLKYATAEWRRVNGVLYADFADNWTAPVVEAELERIEHLGIRFDRDRVSQEAERLLWDEWQKNEMASQSAQGWKSTLTNSRSFVLVWGVPGSDDETEITWEDGRNAELEYEWHNPRKRKAGLKTWVDETTEYATVYLPDHVWKFQRPRADTLNERQQQAEQRRTVGSSGGGWVPREVAAEPWPLPNPMGEVPLVEMPNRPLLGGTAISEIDGVMAMQDSINLMWAYMFLAADYASMDARVILNAEPPQRVILDANGQVIGRKPADLDELREKRLAFLTSSGTGEPKLGTFPKASLEEFLKVIDQAVGHISSQTRTPPTYLLSKNGMSNVNGEGLKASEIGLVKKTISFQRFTSPELRELYRLIALAKGDAALAAAARLGVIRWANPEIRSEAQMADAIQKKKAAGYPLEYLMELEGVSPQDIERILQMIRDEQADLMLQAAMRGVGDGGGDGGPGAAGAGGDRDGDRAVAPEPVAAARI